MRKSLLPCLLALALGGVCLQAAAQSRGDFTVGVGIHQVNPKSDNGKLAGGTLPVSVDSSTRPSVTGEYFVADNLGLEVLAAWPFQHDINIKGLGKVGTTKQLPPVVSLQYHFNSAGKVSPFVGLGVNYTKFFSTDAKGALAGSDLDLGDSWGLAAHAGLDFALSARSALRVDVRWADIDTKVKLNGAKLGTANIDPMVYGAAWVYRF
ncbi:OmpW/AlkL family protein [Pseudoxanthomonas winnipegensis]|uniref:OmpW family protein n=1 Tax=Pseudoxanthomonas winnipegensis TaxID=2480810 RepID=A0A4Q9TAE7_9GAMM|nr:OmpW family outer membrane protein [Pseudoxanthomonas winnipegensis]TAA10971.1 OmpW family protein [Pseudoxanthomonas winnipegensis]TAA18397.1 OmpW family protein [Pseudoxanthomonas winnipegensis]TAA39064.1 OmpW family protein [Pseudoxanthomonas winnipegensis]TAA42389.1 OmpW family protein [Pseudoxanthomonas winnipegensis]TAH74227.1 OmpW family protein [Pseudoxanthomonas winnipegensis]